MEIRELWFHQQQAVEKQRQLPQQDPQASSFALLWDVGVGKSGAAIGIWRSKCNAEQRFLRTIVFTPPVVINKWKKEFLLFSKVPAEKIILLDGPGSRRFKLMANLMKEDQRSRAIVVTNFESTLMPEVFKMMRLWQPEALIIDESQEVKNYKAKRSKKVEELANAGPVIPFKQILSGSPMLNKGAEDLFHQYLILDGGMTLGRNFFVFQARFFRDRNAGMPKFKYFPKWELMTLEKDGFDAASAISKLLERNTSVAKKKDCLTLPPLVEETILLPMTELQARLYREMQRDFVTYIEDKACVATLAMVKALRLLQISSGYIQTNEDVAIELEYTPKMQALEDLLAQITPHSKVLIWATWKANYAQIRRVLERLNIKYVEIHGDISATQKQAAMESLNTDPEVRAMLGHPGAGGVGIDLIEASYSITYSRTFSLKHKIQKDGRNYRGGSDVHARITHIDLVCENTIDELVTKSLQSGIEFSTNLLRDLSLELKKQETPIVC